MMWPFSDMGYIEKWELGTADETSVVLRCVRRSQVCCFQITPEREVTVILLIVLGGIQYKAVHSWGTCNILSLTAPYQLLL